MEQGWDPEIKKYFRKIIFTVSYGLLWMLTAATAGLYFELAYADGKPVIYTVIYYVVVGVTLFFLIRALVKTWKSG